MGPSFSAATEDILAHPLFQDTRRLKHHGADNSVYDHSVATARTAYHMACALGLSDADVISITRAALLHDFFGYDWHDESYRRSLRRYRGIRRLTHMHAFMHGLTAARRASRYFALSDRQCDAIAAHMFPVSPVLPRTREAWILTAADKVVASREMSQCVYLTMRRLFRRALAG